MKTKETAIFSEFGLSRSGRRPWWSSTFAYAHWYDRRSPNSVIAEVKSANPARKERSLRKTSRCRKTRFRPSGVAPVDVRRRRCSPWIPRDLPDELSVNTLDECPHLVAGMLVVCSRDGVEALEPVNGRIPPSLIRDALTERPGETGMLVFKNALRSRRHTAESRNDGSLTAGRRNSGRMNSSTNQAGLQG